MTDNERTAAIRRLNDELRLKRINGSIMLTSAIKALGGAAVARIMAEIARFDGFSNENDPYEEHDCAVMDVGGIRIMWKIDYYDRTFHYGSPDPADPCVTERLMTVMLADEY